MDFKHALAYTTGLVAIQGKPTLTLLQSTTGVKAINLSEFLRVDELGWEIAKAFKGHIALLCDGGELLTDTFVSPKEHTSQMSASSVYCSSQKRILKGQEYAVLVWNFENQTIVVGCQQVKSGQKVFEVTLELIDDFLASDVQITGVRADGFYCKPGFMKPLQARKLHLVTKPRRDSWWNMETQKIQLKKYAETMGIGSFHYYAQEKAYAKSIEVSLRDEPTCKIVQRIILTSVHEG